MSINHTTKNFLDLQGELESQGALLAKWKRIALIADAQTPDGSVSDDAYQLAFDYYVNRNMWAYADEVDGPDFGQEAFANMVVAIALAPPSAQRDALNALIKAIDSVSAESEEEEEDLEFYKSMFNKLGPRLDPSNQALALQWVVENIMSSVDGNGYRNFILDGAIDPDDYSRDYTDEAKAHVGEQFLIQAGEAESEYDFDPVLMSWTTTLLPPDHARYITETDTPDSNGDTEQHSVWVLPKPHGEQELVFVDNENHFLSKNLSRLMREFAENAADTSVSEETRDSIVMAAQTLAHTFEFHAEGRDEQPDIQVALLTSVTALRELNFPE